MSKIADFIPILNWLPGYQRKWLTGDLSAGLTVGVMLIPQGMAYAMLAGLPPIYGLYAALVPLLTYAVFGTSRQLAVGPAALDSLLVLSGVSAIATVGTEHFIEVAILLAFAEGLMLFLLGVLRMGFLVNFLSSPVISGFTSAAALIIAFNQLKHILGVPINSTHLIHQLISEAGDQFHDWNLLAVTVGLSGIVIIRLFKRFLPKVPGSLVLVIISIVLSYTLAWELLGLSVVGDIPQGLPDFAFPMFDSNVLGKLLPSIFTISLIAFLEAISVAKAIHAKHRDYEVKPNQELIALGLSNIFGSFFQSFSVTGGLSRSAVNDQTGAKSPLASIISALLIGLTLLFLTPLFYHLPKAILASIIVVAVSSLFDWREAVRLIKQDRYDFAILVATFISTMTLGIAPGIGLGVALNLGVLLFKAAYPHMARLGEIKGTRYFRNVTRFEEAHERPEMLIIRFDSQLFFANANYFRDKTLEWAGEKNGLQVILFDFQAINGIDSTGVNVLFEMHSFYGERNVKLLFAGVKGPVRDRLHRSGFYKRAGIDCFFMNVAEGKEKYFGESDPDSRKYIHQANSY